MKYDFVTLNSLIAASSTHFGENQLCKDAPFNVRGFQEANVHDACRTRVVLVPVPKYSEFEWGLCSAIPIR